jgi:hypothetical protein
MVGTEQREFRRALRLVVEELQTIEGHLKLISEEGRVPLHSKDQLLPTDAWVKYRDVLAMTLSDRDWDELPTVMGASEQHRRLIVSSARVGCVNSVPPAKSALSLDGAEFTHPARDSCRRRIGRLVTQTPQHSRPCAQGCREGRATRGLGTRESGIDAAARGTPRPGPAAFPGEPLCLRCVGGLSRRSKLQASRR